MGLFGDILAVPFEIISDVTDTIADVLEEL
jgi:hypothetical protein